jgi:hypothetical protein
MLLGLEGEATVSATGFRMTEGFGAFFRGGAATVPIPRQKRGPHIQASRLPTAGPKITITPAVFEAGAEVLPQAVPWYRRPGLILGAAAIVGLALWRRRA